MQSLDDMEVNRGSSRRTQQQVIGTGKHSPATRQGDISIACNYRNRYTDVTSMNKFTQSRSRLLAPVSTDPLTYQVQRGEIIIVDLNRCGGYVAPPRGGLHGTDIDGFSAVNGLEEGTDIAFLGISTNPANTISNEGDGACQIAGVNSTVNWGPEILPPGCWLIIDEHPDKIEGDADNDATPACVYKQDDSQQVPGTSHLGMPSDKFHVSVRRLIDLHCYVHFRTMESRIHAAQQEYGLNFFAEDKVGRESPQFESFLQSDLKLDDWNPSMHYARVFVGWAALSYCVKHVKSQLMVDPVTPQDVIEAYNLLIDLIKEYERREDAILDRESNMTSSKMDWGQNHPVYESSYIHKESDIDSVDFLRKMIEMAEWVRQISMNAMDRRQSYVRKRLMGKNLKTSHPGKQLDVCMSVAM